MTARAGVGEPLKGIFITGRLKELRSSLHLLRRREVMDQDQPAEHFADGKGTLVAIGDPCVRRPCLVKTKEVRVLRHKYSPGLGREGHLLLVANADETNPGGAGHIGASSPQTGRHGERDVLVQVEANTHR